MNTSGKKENKEDTKQPKDGFRLVKLKRPIKTTCNSCASLLHHCALLIGQTMILYTTIGHRSGVIV